MSSWYATCEPVALPDTAGATGSCSWEPCGFSKATSPVHSAKFFWLYPWLPGAAVEGPGPFGEPTLIFSHSSPLDEKPSSFKASPSSARAFATLLLIGMSTDQRSPAKNRGLIQEVSKPVESVQSLSSIISYVSFYMHRKSLLQIKLKCALRSPTS